MELGEDDFEAVEVGEGDFEAVELGEAVPVGGSVADAPGVAGVVVGVPVGVVVGVAVGVGVRVGVGVLVGVGLGVGVGSLSGSHAWPVPLAAAAVTACVVAALARLPWATDTATENPVAVAASTPPVTRLTVTGRTCVKRMSPYPSCSFLRERLFSMVWLHQAYYRPARAVSPLLDIRCGARRHRHYYPAGARLIMPSGTGSMIWSPNWDDS